MHPQFLSGTTSAPKTLKSAKLKAELLDSSNILPLPNRRSVAHQRGM